MPQQSRYSDNEFNALTQDLIGVLQKHQADRELSLMALGNLITGIFNHQVSENNRDSMAREFTRILLKSIEIPATQASHSKP